MFYQIEGDTIVVSRSSLEGAEDGFKQELLYQTLKQSFDQFPAFDELVLRPW